ncbi:MAG: ImmA/IrrE family metallo-endopeptidase [Dehalococcoidia bacterium]|nr:MAG: ImmA/IrrE family metallo-endopeptidase [Dehalococcoidia bacterium]
MLLHIWGEKRGRSRRNRGGTRVFHKIFAIVKSVISRYGLLPPEELAGGFNVVTLDVNTKQVRGCSMTIAGRRLIALNSSLSNQYRRGVLLHEVGHFLLHPGVNRFFLERSTFFQPGRYETEADLFALTYLLLWNRDGFEECGYDVFRFAECYGLSRRAAEVVYGEVEKNIFS